MKKCTFPFILTGFFLILFQVSVSSQYYERNKQNLGISPGFSSGIHTNQKSFSLGISSQINRYLIPEITYRNTTNFNERMANQYGSNLHFISSGLQLRKRIFSTPSRKVRGICTKEFIELAITPEYHLLLNPTQENQNNKSVFALRTSLLFFQYKSGSSKARKAWSYKVEGYYRHGFGEQPYIKKELGVQLRVTRFKVSNFLK